MTNDELGLVGGVADDRCCGDHPGDWDRLAQPGYSFCSECLARIAALTTTPPVP